MSEINRICELLHQKADLQARINLMPYDGTPEVKTQGDKQYLYMRKRVGGKKTSTYVDVYSETLYQLLLKNSRERRELEKNIRKIDRELLALDYTEEDIRPWPKEPEKLPVEDGHVFHLGGRNVTIFHCPGHTAGELVALDEMTGTLLCGDAFNGNFLLDSSHLKEDRREIAYQCLDAMRRIQSMEGAYRSAFNFHHDYRGFGSPLSPDLIGNQITNLEMILSGKADFRNIPDVLNPGTDKWVAEYRNSSITLVDGDIRTIAGLWQ